MAESVAGGELSCPWTECCRLSSIQYCTASDECRTAVARIARIIAAAALIAVRVACATAGHMYRRPVGRASSHHVRGHLHHSAGRGANDALLPADDSVVSDRLPLAPFVALDVVGRALLLTGTGFQGSHGDG